MDGFFDFEVVPSKPKAIFPQCGSCGLFRSCKSPKMKPSGKGKKGILIVGEAPGENEDQRGIQFVGSSGILLKDTMKRFGINPKEDCWFTNALICRPVNNKILKEQMIDFCRPNLLQTIEELKPSTIILLGAKAVRSLIEHIWKEDIGNMTRWAGWRIPCQEPNSWICPTYHPAHILREEKNIILKKYFEKHLEEALQLEGRPWKEIPDYQAQVEIILDPSEAAREVARMQSFGRPIAFDYETTYQKPDRQEAAIVCCAVSNGKRTIAFPWQGKAIEIMKNVLLSDCKKIGYNIKFEERWSRRKLGIKVRNWIWDGMIAAHCLDNRRHITGLKFQSFVNLGSPDYDSHIKPYLKSKKQAGQNRIKELDMESVCKYCGVDALLEFKVAQLQMEKMGYV